jgi:uncharacterized membrane protein YidH (DUF202 family)
MDDLPTVELSFFSILSYSLILTTVSLVFFHMTKYQSIELPHVYAAIFSITLITISVAYIGIALFQYYQRLQAIFDKNEENKDQEPYERTYWMVYLVLGTILTIIQLLICAIMIRTTKV